MGQSRVFFAYFSWVSKNGSKWGKIAQTRDTGLNLELTDIQYGCQLWRCNFSLVESLTEVLVTKSKIRQISLVEYHWSLPRTKHFKTDKHYKNYFGSTFKALTTRIKWLSLIGISGMKSISYLRQLVVWPWMNQ